MERLRDEVAAAVAVLCPDACTPAEADRVLAACTAIADLVEGAAVLMAARAVQGETMRAARERLARQAGSSEGDAERTIACSRALGSLPVVADGLRAGRLSRVQAREVIEAASVNPAAQGYLLDAAGSEDLKGLRDRCGRVKAAADRDPEGTRRRQHAGRYVRTWTASDGSRRGSWSMAPEAAAEVESALTAYADKIFKRAYRAGQREPLDAYRADALVAMAQASTRHPGSPPPATQPETADTETARTDPIPTEPLPVPSTTLTDPLGQGTPGAPGTDRERVNPANGTDPPDPARPIDVLPEPLPTPIARELVVVVDLATLSGALDPRRPPDPGEGICELRGIGPVAASVAAAWLGNSFLKAILTDGTDVRLVKHYGHHVPAALLTAIRYRYPVCSTPGCNRAARLENDHLVAHALGGYVSLDNTRPTCGPCHDAKTIEDMKKIRAARARGEPHPEHDPNHNPRPDQLQRVLAGTIP